MVITSFVFEFLKIFLSVSVASHFFFTGYFLEADAEHHGFTKIMDSVITVSFHSYLDLSFVSVEIVSY